MSSAGSYPSKLSVSADVLVRQAAARYGREFRRLGEPRFGYRSTILFMAGVDEEFVLKVVDGRTRKVEDASRGIQTLDALSKTSVPVPCPVLDMDGEAVWRLGDDTLVLYERAVGVPMPCGEQEHLISAGRILGEIHRLKIPASLPQTHLSEALVGCHANSTSPAHKDLASSLPDGFGVDDVEQCLVHGDFRGQNVLFTDTLISCVLDWDDASIGPRLLDLAYGMIFFQAVLKDSAPSTLEMRSFLKGYVQVNPLTCEDWEQFPVFSELARRKGLRLWSSLLEHARYSDQRARIQEWISSFSALEGEWSSTIGPIVT